jgi:uncharacterized damage-inducible protein DinB
MQELIDLYRHNAWANDQVFEAAMHADPALLGEPAPGTRDTVHGTLTHLALVEYVYLAMLEGTPREQLGAREAYEAQARDLAWLRSQVQTLGNGYLSLLGRITPEQLEQPLDIPWFDFSVSRRDGLLQVLTHSSQHRSQVLSWLSARGASTPDLDYVTMLQALRPATPGQE